MNSSVTHRMQKAVTVFALGMSAALLACGAQAGDSAKATESVLVRYDDLNLASAAGAQTLYARISTAATRACGGEPSLRELHQHQNYRACFDVTVEQAVKKVDSARLQALHAERKSTRSVG